jgi:hypothetical protein
MANVVNIEGIGDVDIDAIEVTEYGPDDEIPFTLSVAQTHGDTISKERMDEIWDDEVEWCCKNRHGVLRNVPKEKLGEYVYFASYFYGCEPENGIWRTENHDGTFDLEFVHMCKVSPPPTAPWDWCGKSVLFKKNGRVRT